MKVYNISDINSLGSDSIVTVGMFDGVHAGHRKLIATLRSLSLTMSLRPLVVTFERHPRQLLDPQWQPQMLSTYEERLRLLESCGVETVVMEAFDQRLASLSACEYAQSVLFQKLHMRALLLGYDNAFGNRRRDDFSQLPLLASQLGFEIVRDSAVTVNGIEVSSTKIRRLLCAGDIMTANAMLGAPYALEGIVVQGRHVGTTLGFPTANVAVSGQGKLLPGEGVYAMCVECDGKSLPAMANLGPQPTFHQDRPVLEVHLLDFSGSLYGAKLRVHFLKRMRDICPFPSADALVAQLQNDKALAKKIWEENR